jgi:hypothetical protein
MLRPEVAKDFANAETANDALTGLINLVRSAARPPRRVPRTRDWQA